MIIINQPLKAPEPPKPPKEWEEVERAHAETKKAYNEFVKRCEALALLLCVPERKVLQKMTPYQGDPLDYCRGEDWLREQLPAFHGVLRRREAERKRQELIGKLKLTTAQKKILGIA